MKRLFVLLCCLSIEAVASVDSAPNRLDGLTLEQAFALSEQLHPELAEARAMIAAADAQAAQGGAFPNPEAIMRVESAPLGGNTPSRAEYLAGISQSVPLGGRLAKARAAGQLEAEHRRAALALKARQMRRNVHAAFAAALYQERVVELYRELTASLARTVELIRARMDAGDALPQDAAQSEMELARVRIEAARAESLRVQAFASLAAAIGNPDTIIQSLDGDLEMAFDLPTLKSLADNLATHPQVLAANAEVEWREARIALAQAERIPDVKVELLYRRTEAGRSDGIDLGLSIPLPIFNRARATVHTAEAERDAAAARARFAQAELKQTLRAAHGQFSSALAIQRAVNEEVLPRAEMVRDSYEIRYKAGDVSLSEVLLARRDWAAAQLSQLESIREVMQAWTGVSTFLRLEH